MSKATPKKPLPVAKPKGKQVSKHAPKAARKAMPTLPQHELPPPYNRLLTLGYLGLADEQKAHAEIAQVLLARDAQAAVARLTAMALDESFNDYGSDANPLNDDPRLWTRLHVVGVLAQMGAAAQAAMEPLLPLLDDEDDWLREELPMFYAAIGQPAIETLRHVLQNADEDTYMRAGAGDSLEQMAEQHAELRPTILPLLEQALVTAGKDDVLASFLICNLLDLNAKESLPLIQLAFAEERVDESVVSMADVEEHFGLVEREDNAEETEDEEIEEEDGRWKTEANAEGRVQDIGNRDQDSGFRIQEHAEEGIQSTIHNRQSTIDPPSAPFVKPLKLGRNDPCWCGSGKKFKQCHG